MKISIELDDDTIDKVTVQNIKWHLDNVKKEVAYLKKLNTLRENEREDLRSYNKVLPALEEVYDFFGGNIK